MLMQPKNFGLNLKLVEKKKRGVGKGNITYWGVWKKQAQKDFENYRQEAIEESLCAHN